jgi:hypothetical protein
MLTLMKTIQRKDTYILVRLYSLRPKTLTGGPGAEFRTEKFCLRHAVSKDEGISLALLSPCGGLELGAGAQLTATLTKMMRLRLFNIQPLG